MHLRRFFNNDIQRTRSNKSIEDNGWIQIGFLACLHQTQRVDGQVVEEHKLDTEGEIQMKYVRRRSNDTFDIVIIIIDQANKNFICEIIVLIRWPTLSHEAI